MQRHDIDVRSVHRAILGVLLHLVFFLAKIRYTEQIVDRPLILKFDVGAYQHRVIRFHVRFSRMALHSAYQLFVLYLCHPRIERKTGGAIRRQMSVGARGFDARVYEV